MEATVVSVGKSVLSGALGFAKSALTEEVALKLRLQLDYAFIRDELEMMLAFLMDGHDECDEHKVVKTWMKQVRDVAYEVDSLEDFAVRLRNPSWWRIFRTLLDRRRVAKQMKELRAKIEDVSQRNVRYHLIKGSETKPASGTVEWSRTGETMSGIEEARREKEEAKMELLGLIRKKDDNLRVIALWGTTGFPQEISIVKMAYDDLKRRKKFECQALVKVTHPFSPTEFLKNIVRQLYLDCLEETTAAAQHGAQDLQRMGMMTTTDELVDAFNKYVNEKRYLIVLTGLSSIEEWEQIKECFPNNKKGSRLLVCAEQPEVASLCVGLEAAVPKHKQLCPNQSLYAFYEKGSPDGSRTDSIVQDSSSSITHMDTTLGVSKESELIGRDKEKSEIIRKISPRHSQEFEVISICGMGGLGKTTLVKHVFQSQELNAMFDKRACVTIKRPFNPSDIIGSLVAQLGDKQEADGGKLNNVLQGKSYLIILDGISSVTEWDALVEYFPTTVRSSRIVVTTREENICNHCSKKERNIYKLQLLGDKDALKLFTEKVFGTVTHLNEQCPDLVDEANLILKKCNGLPLALVTMGGFLAKQPKSATEWRKFIEHISPELEMNMELQRIPNVLIKSYEGLPYHLKSCFLYLSLFPEGYSISRRRLVKRWIAEGYTNDARGKSLEEKANSYFMELIERSMILPSTKSIGCRKGIDSCHLHDFMREISISKAMDENLVFRLEEGSTSSNNTQAKFRHVAISGNWEGDKWEFESALDLAHIRSLTVFGQWRPFFLSQKTRLLRVLDLEGALGLVDHDLVPIGRLIHLRFISLRGCHGIYHLPDSWGSLQQLETLDLKQTSLCSLPKSITKLTKLQYLFAGGLSPFCVNFGERLPGDMSTLCGACCAPKLLKDVELLDGDPNLQDVCTFWCHVVCPTLQSRRLNPIGVVVPRGVRKLKALHTLGVVNIRGTQAILHDIRKLTRLRKLAVTGINKKNCQELCSALLELSHLESLSMQSKDVGLHGCLDGVSRPPKNIHSLKLDGALGKLPEWIGGLENLVKLVLRQTKLMEVDATMQVLGKLPNLGILRLLRCSFDEGEELCVTFHREAFPSLMVLHMQEKSMKFEEAGATPRLEVLVFEYVIPNTRSSISGLSSLLSLKEIVIKGGCSEELMGSVHDQVSGNPNNPVLKRESRSRRCALA